MRTTLDIEDDVLQAVKELARREGGTSGKVISALVRQALSGPSEKKSKAFVYKNGVPVLPHRDGEIITLEHIQSIMDKEGI